MFEQLQKFKTIYEAKNITRASKKLNISQPSLTIAMNKLESLFGLKLFYRSRKGVEPTEAGKMIYVLAKELDVNMENLIDKVEAIKGSQSAQINIGLIDNVAIKAARNIGNGFIKRNPELNINIVIDNSSNLVQQVENLELGFAIITAPTDKLPSQIQFEEFGEDNLVTVVSMANAKKPVRKLPLITYNKNSNSYKQIARQLKVNSIRFENTIFSTSPELILEMVKQDVGVGILPDNIIKRELEHRRIVRVSRSNLNFKRQLLLIKFKSKILNQKHIELLELIKESYS